MDGNLAKEKDLKVTEGVYVDSIAGNSAAGEAGIKIGDVIVKVNDVEVAASAKLLEVIGKHHPGDKVTLKVNRYGKKLDFLVTLRNQEGKTKLYEIGAKEILDVLGVELEEIDKPTAKKLNIDGGIRITKLFIGKLKRHTDVKVGFIITKVDRKIYKTVDALAKYLQDKKGGVMLEGIYEDYPGNYYYAFGL